MNVGFIKQIYKLRNRGEPYSELLPTTFLNFRLLSRLHLSFSIKYKQKRLLIVNFFELLPPAAGAPNPGSRNSHPPLQIFGYALEIYTTIKAPMGTRNYGKL